MENFSYYNPVKVIFGNGTLREIGREAAAIGKKALLVSYKDISFLKNTITDIQDLLRAEGVEFVECFQATANPTLAEARISDASRYASSKSMGIEAFPVFFW